MSTAGIMKLVDLVAFRDATTMRQIVDALEMFPALNRMRAERIAGTSYKVPAITEFPRGEFRAENTGRADAKPVIELRTAEMKFYDASWRVDEMTATGDSRGAQNAIAVASRGAWMGCFAGIEHQLFYGDETEGVVTSGFDGLAKILKVRGRAMDVEGTATGKLTSVFLINERENGILLGNDAQLFGSNPISYGKMMGSNGKEHYGWHQPRSGWVGVDALDYNNAYMIHGIDTTEGATTKTLDDDVIFKALSRFDAGKAPTMIVMSRVAQEQLRASRTATNTNGAPAPTPTEVGGIPIIVSGTIVNNESPEDSGS